MAIVRSLTKTQRKKLEKQLAASPPEIQKLYEKYPSTKLYLLKTTGHRVTISSYSEDGLLTVAVTGEFNAVMFDRDVFGIRPEDLEECDLPPPGSPLGARLEHDEVDDHIDELRVQIRPDLWEMGPDGKAVWRPRPH